MQAWTMQVVLWIANACFTLSFCLCSDVALAVGTTVIYVNASARPSGDGQDWADAYTDLQDALSRAAQTPGTQIWIAKGTYKPSQSGDRSASFKVTDQTSLYGGFAGTETSLAQRIIATNPTTLSGDLASNDIANRADPAYATSRSDNSCHVVTIANAATVTLDGLTISSGNASGQCADDPLSVVGGGIYVSSGGYFGVNSDFGIAQLTLRNVSLSHNDAPGSSLYAGGGGLWQPAGTLFIDRSAFIDNTSPYIGGALVAGDFDLGPTSTMDNVVITNSSFNSNASIVGGIGVIEVRSRGFDIESNSFSQNAGPEGVFQLIYRASNGLNDAMVANNTFNGNRAGPAGFAGALEVLNRVPSGSAAPLLTIRGNTFTQNVSSDYGGALYVKGVGDVLIDQNTFTQNSAGTGGGAVYLNTATGSIAIQNSQFVQNSVLGTPFTYDFVNEQANSGLFYSPALQEGGGAILVDDGSNHVVINTSMFNGNTAPRGGAITVGGFAYYVGDPLDYSQGVPNFADFDLVATAPAAATIGNGNTFLNNQATDGDGGAIFAGAVTTPAVPFAGGMFPAITAFGPTTLVTTRSAFQQNTASSDGGAIAGAQTTATITLNSFFKNDAIGAGDEVALRGSTVNAYSTATQASQALQSLVFGNRFKMNGANAISLH